MRCAFKRVLFCFHGPVCACVCMCVCATWSQSLLLDLATHWHADLSSAAIRSLRKLPASAADAALAAALVPPHASPHEHGPLDVPRLIAVLDTVAARPTPPSPRLLAALVDTAAAAADLHDAAHGRPPLRRRAAELTSADAGPDSDYEYDQEEYDRVRVAPCCRGVLWCALAASAGSNRKGNPRAEPAVCSLAHARILAVPALYSSPSHAHRSGTPTTPRRPWAATRPARRGVPPTRPWIRRCCGTAGSCATPPAWHLTCTRQGCWRRCTCTAGPWGSKVGDCGAWRGAVWFSCCVCFSCCVRCSCCFYASMCCVRC
jgi:hypothetical protein